jgi:hypothetical protein
VEIADYVLWRKGMPGLRTVWAGDSYRDNGALLRAEKPGAARIYNSFPLISPGTHYACRAAGVPAVQTLHYRLLFPAATFISDGHVCEECLERGVWHRVMQAKRDLLVAQVSITNAKISSTA